MCSRSCEPDETTVTPPLPPTGSRQNASWQRLNGPSAAKFLFWKFQASPSRQRKVFKRLSRGFSRSRAFFSLSLLSFRRVPAWSFSLDHSLFLDVQSANWSKLQSSAPRLTNTHLSRSCCNQLRDGFRGSEGGGTLASGSSRCLFFFLVSVRSWLTEDAVKRGSRLLGQITAHLFSSSHPPNSSTTIGVSFLAFIEINNYNGSNGGSPDLAPCAGQGPIVLNQPRRGDGSHFRR